MQLKKLCKILTAALIFSLAVPAASTAAQAQKTEVKKQESDTSASAESTSTEQDDTEAPATEAPATETPATEEPATDTPQSETPGSETPGSSTPDTEEPVTEEPGADIEDPDDVKPGVADTEDPDDGKDRKRNKKKKVQNTEDQEPYVPDERFTQVAEPEKVETSFRFTTVDKVYAIAKENRTRVYGNVGGTGKAVGILDKDALCFILQDEEGGWSYIESGNVRGFVKTSSLETGEIVEKRVRLQGELIFKRAAALVKSEENPAWTYTKTTTGATVVDKEYALSNTEGLNVREEKDTESRIVGKLNKDGICFVLADRDEEWTFVESGDVRGFVKSEYLIQGREAKEAVKEKGEATFPLASELIEPKDNKSCYYTFTSVTEADADTMKYLGNFTLTAYCSCPLCCGKWSGGMAAGGVYPVQGRTVAMAGVEFGTKLVIGDQVYTVEDRGTPYGHVDIYLVNHSDAVLFGRQNADVYLLKEADDSGEDEKIPETEKTVS